MRPLPQGGLTRRCLLLVGVLGGVNPLANARAPAKPKDYTAHLFGYAHMDMAWLWWWEESFCDIMSMQHSKAQEFIGKWSHPHSNALDSRRKP